MGHIYDRAGRNRKCERNFQFVRGAVERNVLFPGTGFPFYDAGFIDLLYQLVLRDFQYAAGLLQIPAGLFKNFSDMFLPYLLKGFHRHIEF